ncbi:hypothetical protein GCM10011344_48150 [Dokdonia pacifica]|uniref:Uncharacterized protein n=1 Tax=Dokdonia pacifica TaxID=1627892 RepID=A0A239ADR4_9FLAO|nr:hypothetical protein GCM10011344_48150 [Dokdonia pacifica]SNR93491.1 hypothetical protein SAMN06265376_104341 [Dokdonia pacifica]
MLENYFLILRFCTPNTWLFLLFGGFVNYMLVEVMTIYQLVTLLLVNVLLGFFLNRIKTSKFYHSTISSTTLDPIINPEMFCFRESKNL